MISFINVNKIYHGKGNDYHALNNINFSIMKGEYVLIVGKSGSGKSTLLNILTGVDTTSSGKVLVDGTNILPFSETQMTKWRGENIGIIFQFFQLIPTLSVLENILLPMDMIGKVPVQKRESKALHLLETVGLKQHANKMPQALSGGEQQRVAIARALANDVDFIVADEPTGNLDSENTKVIFDLLYKLNQSGKTIIMVTHDNERIKGASRKLILRDGKLQNDYILESYGLENYELENYELDNNIPGDYTSEGVTHNEKVI